MPAPISSPSSSLRHHLLGGASALAIALAVGLTAPTGAMAQTELTDGFAITADEANGVIESDAVAGVTGTVDTNAGDAAADSAVIFGATGGNSILNSTDQTLTFNISDSVATTAVGYLVLDEAVTVTGGGTIALNLGGANSAGIVFNGSVTETSGTITITVGDAAGGVDTFDLVFASDQDRDLTIDAAITAQGDDDIVLRVVDTDNTSANTITFTDSVNVGTDAGDMIVIDANAAEGATGGDLGGDYDVATAGVTGVFQGDVTAGSIVVDATSFDAALVLGANGATTTVTADIDSVNAANNTALSIADGANVRVIGDILSTAAWTGGLTVGTGTTATTLTLQGTLEDQTNVTLNDMATFVIDSADGPEQVNSAIAAAANATTTVRTTGANGVTFGDEVGAAHAISTLDVDTNTIFNGNVSGGTLDVADTFTATLDGAANAITGDISGAGTLAIGGTDTLTLGANGATSTVSIANLGGAAATQGNIAFAAGSMVTINSTIGSAGANSIGNFTLDDANTTVTINSTDTEAVTGGGNLTLGEGTLILGSNIGADDTVFEFTSEAGLITTANDTLSVQVAVNFTNGEIILANTAGDQSAAHDDDASNGEITVVNNALTTYQVEEGTTNQQIIITANATTDTQAAATLGVSSEQASALRQALASADAAGDTTGLDALSAAINAGGTQAATAAQQVGVQGETIGGGAQVAFQTSSQQQGVTSNRLAGFRSGDARFSSAFAATETGFSGGDLDGPYASAPRYSNSFWFQGFGGVADADGDALIAGYDAAFGGAMIGVDGMVSDNLTIGAFGSYTYSSVDGDGAGNAQLDANTYAIGVYAGYTGQSFYLDGFASYAGSDNDVSRTALAQTITANYDASQFAIGAAMGVPLEVSSNVFITPNASLTYNHYEADSYTETGSAGFSARVNPGSASQLTGTLGARIHAVYEYASGTSFIPELRIGVIGDLVDDDAVSTATFVGGGTAFNVTGTDTDDIGALIGVGFALDNAGWSAGLSYDGDIRSDYMSHTARAEFRWKF